MSRRKPEVGGNRGVARTGGHEGRPLSAKALRIEELLAKHPRRIVARLAGVPPGSLGRWIEHIENVRSLERIRAERGKVGS